MARLVAIADGHANRVIELHLGVNQFGRSPNNEFRIEHSTVSAHHCQVVLAESGVVVRDCDSTNGTYVDGQRVTTAQLSAGQILRLGTLEFLVESTAVTIAIPQFETPRPAPPVVLTDGSLLCPRHPHAKATHQCTHCREVLCDTCVHRLRRRGGRLLKLCPLCSHRCEPLGGEKKKKKSLFGFLHQTVKLPFLLNSKRDK